MHKLCPHYHAEVFRATVSLAGRLHTLGRTVARAAVVALAMHILERIIGREMIALIGRIEVIVQSTAMNSVVELLGDVGFVGRHMQHVSAPAILAQSVILQRELGVVGQPQIGVQANGLIVQVGHLGVAVAVVVVARPVAVLPVDIETGLVVLRDDGSIHRGIVVKPALASYRHQ